MQKNEGHYLKEGDKQSSRPSSHLPLGAGHIKCFSQPIRVFYENDHHNAKDMFT